MYLFKRHSLVVVPGHTVWADKLNIQQCRGDNASTDPEERPIDQFKHTYITKYVIHEIPFLCLLKIRDDAGFFFNYNVLCMILSSCKIDKNLRFEEKLSIKNAP